MTNEGILLLANDCSWLAYDFPERAKELEHMHVAFVALASVAATSKAICDMYGRPASEPGSLSDAVNDARAALARLERLEA